MPAKQLKTLDSHVTVLFPPRGTRQKTDLTSPRSALPSTRPSLLCSATTRCWGGFGNLAEPFAGSRFRDRRYDDGLQLFESHLARIRMSFRQAASHHLATFTLKVTVLVPPAFLMTNLYCPSFSGVTLTEHFGPDESSLATSAPVES
jgi:hypothetical protein